jgi:hypothetical protein
MHRNKKSYFFGAKKRRQDKWMSYKSIDLYEAWNKPEKAKEWQSKLPKTEPKIE